MSNVKELADAEAARAEVEPDEEPADEPGEEEQEQEAQEAAPAELPTEPTDKQLRSLDNENQRHEKRVREIMGAFVAGLVTCEECSGVGLTPPDPEPKAHADYKECPTCVGYGKVKTGSRDPQHALAACPTCVGRGFLQRLVEGGTAPVAAQNGEQGADEFGIPSWAGNPQIKPEPIFAAPPS